MKVESGCSLALLLVPPIPGPAGQLQDAAQVLGQSDFPSGHAPAVWRWLTDQGALRKNGSESFAQHPPACSAWQNTGSAGSWTILCAERLLNARQMPQLSDCPTRLLSSGGGHPTRCQFPHRFPASPLLSAPQASKQAFYNSLA